MEKVKTVLRQIIEVGLLILALGILIQVILGSVVPFFPVDLVGQITKIIKALGDGGLVGLLAGGVIIYLFKKKG